jgi:hypothetical protein
MGKARFDTYVADLPDNPPFPPYGSLKDARDRKQELKEQGYRVKIRMNREGAYTLFKKHDQLFHRESRKARRDNNG